MSTDKNHLYELIDRLPESEVRAAERFLEFLAQDRFATASIDDEPETEDEAFRVAAAKSDVASGNFARWEEVRERIAG
ncbi:MAG: hypothetical protein M3Z23_09235 [Acidobacteriota bacterium]|nr:hypothetical protein [Acidobacteriota bacterium]